MALFLDTNVLVRHLTQDSAELSPRATSFLQRLERGELTVRIADTVVFETVFLLERRYRRPRPDIAEAVMALLALPAIELPDKQRIAQAFDLYLNSRLSFADAYHVVIMEQLGIEEVVSFDRDFDRVPGIRRVEPR
jgi:predicted nucleic acid-binding protein